MSSSIYPELCIPDYPFLFHSVTLFWLFPFLLHIGSSVMVGKLQVAELIKDDLWPNPLTYFNNVSSVYVFVTLPSLHLICYFVVLCPLFPCVSRSS